MDKLKENLKKIPIELIIILATLVAYLIAVNIFTSKETGIIPIIIAAIIGFEIVFFVAVEIKQGVKKHGWKHEIVDTLVAVFIAVLLWISASIILNSSTPISAVASCSMLPNLERGDFIIVQGAEAEAYEISMTLAELDSLNGPVTVERYDGAETTLSMPLYAYCACNPSEELCRQFSQAPELFTEKQGPFSYHYAMCEVEFEGGVKGYGKCLQYVEFRGRKYYANMSNDIIVYVPASSDLYYQIGDIVHRLFFKIDVNGETYYLTKGDNNPIMDIQAADMSCKNLNIRNHPVAEESLRGKVIGRVPYLGYLKLFIIGQWTEDEQCGWQINYATVN